MAGLEERWVVADKPVDEDNMTASKLSDYYNKLIGFELDRLLPVKDAAFDNPELKEVSTKYITELEKSMEARKFYEIDHDRYIKEWKSEYKERTMIIYQLFTDYGLKLSENASETTENSKTELMYLGYQNLEEEALLTLAGEMTDFSNFELSEESSYRQEYQATIENITNVTFRSFSFTVLLYDENDIIIDSLYGSTIQNFKPGAKALFSFTTYEDFSRVEITPLYYLE